MHNRLNSLGVAASLLGVAITAADIPDDRVISFGRSRPDPLGRWRRKCARSRVYPRNGAREMARRRRQMEALEESAPR